MGCAETPASTDDPYAPPPQTAQHRPRTWIGRAFPAVLFIDLVGCTIFLVTVILTVILLSLPAGEAAWLGFAGWYLTFLALHVLRVLVFMLADVLLLYRSPLCYGAFLLGYALTLARLVFEPRFVGFNPWFHLAQILIFLGWNAFFLLVARVHLRRGRRPGRQSPQPDQTDRQEERTGG